ncbi:hypothetical protein BJ170DRAFT_690750 [Xylariales sp. AK1849]|nr:hypothetical protein BJ170DRAFT_690750 [Xylariales sp. AK1849]
MPQIEELPRSLHRKCWCLDKMPWNAGKHINGSIKVSKEGKAKGDFMHNGCGTLDDLNPATDRAFGKMKPTITQRFAHDGLSYNIDCDSKFISFCFETEDGWKALWSKVSYASDKLAMVGLPTQDAVVKLFSKETLLRHSEGYR